MKKISLSTLALSIFVGISIITISSCTKEKSFENPNDPGGNILIGNNCRVSKIAFSDSISNVGTGSVSAAINDLDTTTSVTRFDSLANVATFSTAITYGSDTAYINANEYFILDVNKRVTKLHSLSDPKNPNSQQIEVDYIYDLAGHLIKKYQSLTMLPNTPLQETNYTYTNNNLTSMTTVDLVTNDNLQEATLEYYNDISPKNYIYLFPDEKKYAPFNQFLNFGTRNLNAVKSIKVRNFDPNNVPKDSTLSTFANYVLSLDKYVVSATMTGSDLNSIPAVAGRLKFSYKCSK